MGSIHPIFETALKPFAPLSDAANQACKSLQPFDVRLVINCATPVRISILAFTSCDAISKAIDMYFDGDEAMPENLAVVAHQVLHLPPMAA